MSNATTSENQNIVTVTVNEKSAFDSNTISLARLTV